MPKSFATSARAKPKPIPFHTGPARWIFLNFGAWRDWLVCFRKDREQTLDRSQTNQADGHLPASEISVGWTSKELSGGVLAMCA